MEAHLDEDPSREGTLLSDRRRIQRVLDEARERVALLIGCRGEEVVFTSGATEATNLALKGSAFAPPGEGERKRILVGATESTSVLHPARTLARLGWTVEEISVDPSGRVREDHLAALLDERVLLVSLSLVTAETGVIQPLRRIADLAHARGALLHTDASAAAAHLPIDVPALGVDLMSLSAHRMYGPRGAGALFVREGVRLTPLIEGGTGERGLRGGMPSVAALAGFGEAAALAMVERPAWRERTWDLGRRIARGILETIPVAVQHGACAERVDAMGSFGFAGAEGEALLLALGRAGVAASSGSACLDETGKPSHVLLAMGVPPRLAQSTVLFAVGRDNRVEEIDYLLEALRGAVGRLRGMSAVEVG
jgi:cysteine desulfurase